MSGLLDDPHPTKRHSLLRIVLALVAIPFAFLALSLVGLFPWSGVNCWEDQIDITSGRIRHAQLPALDARPQLEYGLGADESLAKRSDDCLWRQTGNRWSPYRRAYTIRPTIGTTGRSIRSRNWRSAGILAR